MGFFFSSIRNESRCGFKVFPLHFDHVSVSASSSSSSSAAGKDKVAALSLRALMEKYPLSVHHFFPLNRVQPD